MTIIDDLLTALPPEAPVKDVLVGLFWTAVHSRGVGLAATPTDTTCCGNQEPQNVGRLQEQSAHALAGLLRSAHPVEVSVGLAALNSLYTLEEGAGVELNARELLLARGRGKNVVTVGHFPFTDALREVAAQVTVLELRPGPGDVPASAAPERLPLADIIGLTASTLLNGTFDSLAKLFPPRALVVMLGPSTPMTPVLFDHGVHVLGGAQAKDPAAAFRWAGQASSMHRVPGLIRVTLVKDRRLVA
jgi:uncharacterized protein (DUF4213/DUF364 family)